jgi:hypothetical protein
MFGWESPASGLGSSMAADRASRQRLPERSSLPPGVATGRPSVPFTVLSPAAARRTLASPTLLLCVAGVVLPNLLSLGALAAGIGMPPRTTAIAAYAALALVARSAPRSITIAFLLAVAGYDATATIALLFNLAPSEIATALQLSAELKLFESPLYIAIAIGAAGVLGANLAMLTLARRTFARGNALVMAALALAFGAADFLTNTSAHYRFGTLYARGKPIESASLSSGFRSVAADAGQGHVLMVMVEALGLLADPAQHAILLEPFRNSELLRRYTVTTGDTTYYGSTTAAEMRELCDTREPYQAILEGKSLACLPELAATRGHRTVAFHNFTKTFFERLDWYPRIGFQKSVFGEDMTEVPRRRCGGPFKGICDVDVVTLIARELQSATKPTFAYWLTLSTHVPIAPRQGTPRLGCEGGGPVGQVEVCYMMELWVDLFKALVDLTADIPPTDILIVGDHAPPLWSKTGRGLFEPGKVPWIRLKPVPQAQAKAG